jgi:hypothetical protein
LHVGPVYRAAAWQCVDQICYNIVAIIMSRDKIPEVIEEDQNVAVMRERP